MARLFIFVFLILTNLHAASAPDTIWECVQGDSSDNIGNWISNIDNAIINSGISDNKQGRKYNYIAKISPTGQVIDKSQISTHPDRYYNQIITKNGLLFLGIGCTSDPLNKYVCYSAFSNNYDTLWTRINGEPYNFYEEGVALSALNDSTFLSLYTSESFGDKHPGLATININKATIDTTKIFKDSIPGSEVLPTKIIHTTNNYWILGTSFRESKDPFILNLSNDLTINWSWLHSFNSTDETVFFAASFDNLYNLAYINSQTVSLKQQIALISLDSTGTETGTSKIYGGTEDDIGHHAIKTWDNGSLIVGETESYGAGKKDLWVLRCDMYGDTIWTATYGDTGDQCGMYVAQTADTGYVITGYTTSGGYGGQDAWVVRLESENTVGEVNILGSDHGDKTDRIRNLTVTTDTTLTLYAATYGLVNQYLGNRSVTWSSITVADSFSWQAADAESIVIDPMRPGSGKLVATYTGPRRTVSCTTGIITILPGELDHVGLNRNATADMPFIADTTITTDDTLYFWCMGYDADGNVLGDTTASWFANGTLSEDAFTELSGAATAFSQKIPGTGYLYCRYTTGMKDSIKVTVEPGRLAILAIRDSSGNRGKEIDSMQVETGETITLYLAGYDAYGNYRQDQEGTWYSIQDAPFFAYMSSSLTSAWDFTPTLLGRGYLYAGTGGVQDTTGLITVIKNLPPSALLTAPSGIQIDDVELPFVLSDSENDTLDIACEYSTDLGTTWLTATVTGTTNNLLPAGYADTLTWLSGTDLNGWVADSVLFRVIPSDKKSGTGDTVCFGIRNILGDYNRNMTIDFEDVTAFTMAWHTADSAKDIGPVTGLVPKLLLQPDGYVEFEDLYTFVLMWDWCYRDSLADPAHYPVKAAAGTSPVSLVRTGDGVWSIRLHGIPEPMAVSLSLQFDQEITGLYEGSSLQGFGCTPIFLKKTGSRGEAAVQAALLDGHWMSDNSLELATVTTAGTGDNTVQVSWDIRDFDNSVISRGTDGIAVQPSTDVLATDNLAAYPNPFSTSDAVTIPGPFNTPIVISDIYGKKVTTLYPSSNAGSITWDGTDNAGKPVPAGIYSISGRSIRLIKLP